MSKDILQQLTHLKSHQSAGGVSGAARERSRAKLLEAIGAQPNVAPQVGGQLAFVKWNVLELISTRVAAGAAVFVLVLGGWTTVNAASASLPGDTLYRFKLATEAAQIQFASGETRAVLHGEFAQRRLDELVALKQSDDPAAEQHVEATVLAFNKEVSAAQDELRKLKDEGRSQTVAVASQLDASINALQTVIDKQASGEVQDAQTQEVVTKVQEAGDSVVDVVVETHESSATEYSARELELMFQSELAELRTRQTIDLGRLLVIQNALAANPEIAERVHIPTSISVMEHALTSATDAVPEAMNLIAAGGYRRAFELLRASRATLLDLEKQMAAIEISITEALIAQDPATQTIEPSDAPPAASDTEVEAGDPTLTTTEG